jgi:hypothetical protein
MENLIFKTSIAFPAENEGQMNIRALSYSILRKKSAHRRWINRGIKRDKYLHTFFDFPNAGLCHLSKPQTMERMCPHFIIVYSGS